MRASTRLLTSVAPALLVGCQSIGLEAVRSSPGLDAVDAELTGFGVVLAEGPLYFEWQELSDDDEDLDWRNFNFGGRFARRSFGAFDIGAEADIGLAHADLDRLINSNTLASVATGVFLEARPTERFALSASLGGRYFFDTTDPTTCNDGTTSTSTGPGTCSHHGGVAHLNDPIGDGFALEISLGVRIVLRSRAAGWLGGEP